MLKVLHKCFMVKKVMSAWSVHFLVVKRLHFFTHSNSGSKIVPSSNTVKYMLALRWVLTLGVTSFWKCRLQWFNYPNMQTICLKKWELVFGVIANTSHYLKLSWFHVSIKLCIVFTNFKMFKTIWRPQIFLEFLTE